MDSRRAIAFGSNPAERGAWVGLAPYPIQVEFATVRGVAIVEIWLRHAINLNVSRIGRILAGLSRVRPGTAIGCADVMVGVGTR